MLGHHWITALEQASGWVALSSLPRIFFILLSGNDIFWRLAQVLKYCTCTMQIVVTNQPDIGGIAPTAPPSSGMFPNKIIGEHVTVLPLWLLV